MGRVLGRSWGGRCQRLSSPYWLPRPYYAAPGICPVRSTDTLLLCPAGHGTPKSRLGPWERVSLRSTRDQTPRIRMNGVIVGPMDVLGPPSLPPVWPRQPEVAAGHGRYLGCNWVVGEGQALCAGSISDPLFCSLDTRLCRASHPQPTGLGVLRGHGSGQKGTGWPANAPLCVWCGPEGWSLRPKLSSTWSSWEAQTTSDSIEPNQVLAAGEKPSQPKWEAAAISE